jgi:hypothetical protein
LTAVASTYTLMIERPPARWPQVFCDVISHGKLIVLQKGSVQSRGGILQEPEDNLMARIRFNLRNKILSV